MRWLSCPTHDRAIVYEPTEQCFICYLEAKRPEYSIRETANIFRIDRFPSVCEVHGKTLAWTSNGQCAACVTRANKKREPKHIKGSTRQRLDAWKACASSYVADCSVHDFVPHHTKTGLCAHCFTLRATPLKFG